MIDKFLDMMSKWQPFGQALFIIIVLLCTFGFIKYIVDKVVFLIRGWPTDPEAQKNLTKSIFDE